MIVYDINGLRCLYPDNLRKEYDFPFFSLLSPTNKKDIFTVGLVPVCISPNEHFYQMIDWPRVTNFKDRKIEVIRYGDFNKFAGAKEILVNAVTNYGSSNYTWDIVIPTGGRLIDVHIQCPSLDTIEDIWAPIVHSIEFDPDKFTDDNSINSSPIKKYNWRKNSKRKYFKHSFCIVFSSFIIYDSKRQIDEEPPSYSEESFKNLKIFKQSQQATIFVSDDADLTVEFYLVNNPNDIDRMIWDHIVEGIISLPSGKLFAMSDVEHEVEVLMDKGNYKFWVCYGGLDFTKNDQEYCAIYFGETNEEENNDIKIIKDFRN